MKSDNKFFERARKRAAEILNNQERLKSLLMQSKEKLSRLEINNINHSKLFERVNLFVRMVKSHVRGDYRVHWQSIVIIVAALIYFVTPLDLIPDLVPVTGYVDDLSILLWVNATLQKEIDAFRLWEQGATVRD